MPPDWTLLPRPSCHALQASRCRPGPPASHFPLPTLCSLSEASPMHLDDSYLGKPLARRHGRARQHVSELAERPYSSGSGSSDRLPGFCTPDDRTQIAAADPTLSQMGPRASVLSTVRLLHLAITHPSRPLKELESTDMDPHRAPSYRPC